VSCNLRRFTKVFQRDKPLLGTFLLEDLVVFWELNILDAQVDFTEGQFILANVRSDKSASLATLRVKEFLLLILESEDAPFSG